MTNWPKTTEGLIKQLANALRLVKCDAEKNGFEYGEQSNVVRALKAYEEREKFL